MSDVTFFGPKEVGFHGFFKVLSMVFHGFWLVYMVFNVVSWFFHGFWLVSMVFQGGFMVFGWFQ